MTKQSASRILAALLCSSMALTACGNEKAPENSKSSGESSKAETSSAVSSGEATPSDTVSFENIEFPESMPKNPTLAESSYYDYDDMSKKYQVEFFTYNYGVTPPENDPILAYMSKKYNVDLTLTTVPSADVETTLSTRFASGSEPDLMSMPTRDFAFTIGDQGLLVDGKEQYPYMPQTCKFVTKTLIQYSSLADGSLPFTTKYSIQDGDIWGYGIRQDWLEKFGMQPPKSREELLAYAKACVENDPDGNGKADTYFMSGAGAGKAFGMLDAFQNMFGNTSEHVGESGELVSPMFDGTRKAYLQFINELYTNGYLTPDWYTIDWEQNKSYTMNDRVGMVWYPSSNLYEEYYRDAKARDPQALDVWTYWKETPIENGKYGPSGNAGVLWSVSKRKIGDDKGKLMRICHMLDGMTYGGEDYFATVQGGGQEVHEGYTADVRKYTDDGLSICYVDKTHPGFNGTYGTNNLELAAWQNFGYTLKYQMSYESDPNEQKFADKRNEMSAVIASYPRWPNDPLLISLPAGTAPNLQEFEYAQNFKFATGERSFDDWDNYVKEWLDQGGRDKMKATAESLGCTLPDAMK